MPHPTLKDRAWVNVGLRGDRPVGEATHLSFRYKLEGAHVVQVALESPDFAEPIRFELKELIDRQWGHINVNVDAVANLKLRKGDRLRAVSFTVPMAAQLWIDDLLLYEPAP